MINFSTLFSNEIKKRKKLKAFWKLFSQFLNELKKKKIFLFSLALAYKYNFYRKSFIHLHSTSLNTRNNLKQSWNFKIKTKNILLHFFQNHKIFYSGNFWYLIFNEFVLLNGNYFTLGNILIIFTMVFLIFRFL